MGLVRPGQVVGGVLAGIEPVHARVVLPGGLRGTRRGRRARRRHPPRGSAHHERRTGRLPRRRGLATRRSGRQRLGGGAPRWRFRAQRGFRGRERWEDGRGGDGDRPLRRSREILLERPIGLCARSRRHGPERPWSGRHGPERPWSGRHGPERPWSGRHGPERPWSGRHRPRDLRRAVDLDPPRPAPGPGIRIGVGPRPARERRLGRRRLGQRLPSVGLPVASGRATAASSLPRAPDAPSDGSGDRRGAARWRATLDRGRGRAPGAGVGSGLPRGHALRGRWARTAVARRLPGLGGGLRASWGRVPGVATDEIRAQRDDLGRQPVTDRPRIVDLCQDRPEPPEVQHVGLLPFDRHGSVGRVGRPGHRTNSLGGVGHRRHGRRGHDPPAADAVEPIGVHSPISGPSP
jgi:hypothetical protein